VDEACSGSFAFQRVRCVWRVGHASPYSDIGSRQRPACVSLMSVELWMYTYPSQTAIFPTLRLLRSTMSEVLQGSTSVFLCLCLGRGA